MVEPDPKCRGILKALLPLYPNVTLAECALSPKSCLTLNAVEGFGSSETSALAIGDGCSIEVEAARWPNCSNGAGPGPLFVKIDIEGYEYEIADELRRLDCGQVKGVQLAVHPALYEKSLGGPFSSVAARRSLQLFGLARLYRRLERARSVGNISSSLATYLVRGVALRPVPRARTFFSLTPGPRCNPVARTTH